MSIHAKDKSHPKAVTGENSTNALCSPKCRLSSVRLDKLTTGIPQGQGKAAVWQDGTNDSRGKS
jgi:hypothetical protein